MKIADAIETKDAAIALAIKTIEALSECSEKTCEENYHWGGCPKTLKPIIDTLKMARGL